MKDQTENMKKRRCNCSCKMKTDPFDNIPDTVSYRTIQQSGIMFPVFEQALIGFIQIIGVIGDMNIIIPDKIMFYDLAVNDYNNNGK